MEAYIRQDGQPKTVLAVWGEDGNDPPDDWKCYTTAPEVTDEKTTTWATEGYALGARRQRLVAQIASELRHTRVVPASAFCAIACICR
jgi:hypothetical protein